MAKKKVTPKAKVTVTLSKAPMMMGEPIDYSNLPKKTVKEGPMKRGKKKSTC